MATESSALAISAKIAARVWSDHDNSLIEEQWFEGVGPQTFNFLRLRHEVELVALSSAGAPDPPDPMQARSRSKKSLASKGSVLDIGYFVPIGHCPRVERKL